MFRLCVSFWLLTVISQAQAGEQPASATAAVPPAEPLPHAAESGDPPPVIPACAPGATRPPAEPVPMAVELQPVKPSTGDGNAELLQFKERVQRGIHLFQQGDFDGAIQTFTAAYAISPRPMLLFNIGQAHRKAGRPQQALTSYQLFLRKAKDTPLRAETLAYMELVCAQLQAMTKGPAPQSLVAAVPPVQRIPRYKRGWLWAVVGTTFAAATGVAIGVYLGTRPSTPTLGIVEPTF